MRKVMAEDKYWLFFMLKFIFILMLILVLLVYFKVPLALGLTDLL